MSAFELKFEVPLASADAIDDTLLEIGEEAWSLLENVISKQAWVIGIFPSAEAAEAGWKILREQLPVAPIGERTMRELPENEWRDSYKMHFHAWQFGRLHWVPVWQRETFRLPAGDAVLWLDPGLAFGTGNHETTRLCVERLVELAEREGTGGSVLDAGCGSGILALSASKLGFVDVAGFDNDPEAVRVSEENAVLNGLDRSVGFFVGDLVSGLAGVQANVLLANILANVLMQFAGELTGAVAPGGTLVLSGILAGECDQVRSAFGRVAPGWPQESRTMGEWSDVVLRRPGA